MYVIYKGSPPTFSSSNALCDAIFDAMMLSRGFASHYAKSEYTPLGSNWFHEAILGSRQTFKNVEEFRNALYQMSLGGTFSTSTRKKSPNHMLVKCSIEGCP